MQRSFPALSRFALLLEACGSWQLTQFPSRTTLCVLTALAGTTLVWHVRQMALVGAARSFPWFEACGLWHPAQLPVFTGVWTNLLLSLSWKSVWQSKQILPVAPGFNRYLFWPCAAGAVATRSSVGTSVTHRIPRRITAAWAMRPPPLAHGRWHSSHVLAPNGMWMLALKNFGSFDACGSWHFRQSMTVGSMLRCALVKAGRCGVWHSKHVGWMAWLSKESCAEKCGLWHRSQSLAAGGWARSTPIRPLRSLWQVRQSSGLFARSSPFSRDLCGLWHWVHWEIATGSCLLLAALAPVSISAWHCTQSWPSAAFSSFSSLPPWATWHALQVPSATGLCVYVFRNFVSASEWHR